MNTEKVAEALKKEAIRKADLAVRYMFVYGAVTFVDGEPKPPSSMFNEVITPYNQSWKTRNQKD